MTDMDDVAVLMPRTRAANERAPVNAKNLTQYMARTQRDETANSGARQGVRKDDQGFEDIDEFWAEDDALDDRDNTDEDSSLATNDISLASTSSEREIHLSIGDGDDMELASAAPRGRASSRRRSSITGRRTSIAKRTAPTRKSEPEEFSFGAGSPIGSPENPADADDEQMNGSLSTADLEKRKKRRETVFFSHSDEGFSTAASPFDVDEAAVTPMSNASEKELKSMRRFSSDSPDSSIQRKLFDGKKEKTKKGKKTKAKLSTPKSKSSPRYLSYKSTPTANDTSMEQETDNDTSFQVTSATESDENDSDWDDKKPDRTQFVRDANLSYADQILADDDSPNEDAPGLRRSKRRRIKPLKWYKGEHYVYERVPNGLGMVLPTVARVERSGASSPAKKRTTKNSRGKRTMVRKHKPFPRDELPAKYTYAKDEWAELYDTSVNTLNMMNVVCRANQIEKRELPSVDGQPVGYAGQRFNLRHPTSFSRWITGTLNLPAGAAKDAESVDDAVQVFYVTDCQPQALEVAVSPLQDGDFDPATATRFLLNPHDEFYVPAQNAYFLKNHSTTTDCDLNFTILKPARAPRPPSPGVSAENKSPSFRTPGNRKRRSSS